MRDGNVVVLAAVLLSGVSACASEALRNAADSPAAHPLVTKTLVVVVRYGEIEAEQSQVQQFDKNFSIRAIDTQKMGEQLREALRDREKEGYQAFWVVATGQAASQVISDYNNVVEALSSAGAWNYRVVLLNPNEEALKTESLSALEDKNLSIVEYEPEAHSEYRDAVSRFEADHTDGILSWIEAQGIGSAPSAWDELSSRDLFKIARVATRTLGPKSLPAKKETLIERKVSREDSLPIVPDAYEAAIAEMIVNHPQQKRTEMVYCPFLHLVARAKALDMARRKYFNHVDPDGFGPNYVMQSLGYELAKGYGRARNANSFESINMSMSPVSGKLVEYGTDDASLVADKAINSFMASPPHQKHLFGHDANIRKQTRYGIGYAIDHFRGRGGQLMKARLVAFIAAPPSLTELPPLTEKVVYDYLTQTPAQRARKLKKAKTP